MNNPIHEAEEPLEIVSGPDQRVSVIKTDESGVRYGTVTAWADYLGYTTGLQITTFLQRKGVKRYGYCLLQGREIDYWSEEDLEGLRDNGQDRKRKPLTRYIPLSEGMYADVDDEIDIFQLLISHQQRTVREWEMALGYSRSYLRKRLDTIQAVEQRLPKVSAYALYSFDAIMATKEHYDNLTQPASEIYPDPEFGTVVGSIQAWATTLSVNARGLRNRFDQTPQTPVNDSLSGRDKSQLYSLEQIQVLASDYLHPPLWKAQQPGVVILPEGQERYVVVGDKQRKALLEAGVDHIRALTTIGQPAIYFRESAVLQRRGNQAVQPITANEYQTAVAVPHPFYAKLPNLRRMQEQAQFLQCGVETLNQDGIITLSDGRRVAPRSVLIKHNAIGRGNDKPKNSNLFDVTNEKAVAIADVRWPGHWKGVARLWLYDLEVAETKSVNDDAQQLAALRQALADLKHTEYLATASEFVALPPKGEVPFPEQFQELSLERTDWRELEPPLQPKSPVQTLPQVQPTTPSSNAAETDNMQSARLSNAYRKQKGAEDEQHQKQQLKRQVEKQQQAYIQQTFKEDQRRLKQAQEAMHRLHQQPESAAVNERRQRIEDRLQQILTKQAGVEKEVFKIPLDWLDDYDKTFRELTVTNVSNLINLEGSNSRVELLGTNSKVYISERDILRFLLTILEQREKR